MRGGAVRCEGAEPQEAWPVRCEEAEPQEAHIDLHTRKARKKHSNPHDISSKLLSFFVVHFYIINSLFVG